MGFRLRLRVLPVVVLASIALALPCTAVSAQERSPRTILAINWGAEDFPGTAVLNEGIRKALESHSDAQINYFVEYLESEAFPASAPALRDYIRQKYASRRIDLIIAITTPALEFALGYRRELFPDIPIVFLAGTISNPAVGRAVPGITGIVSDATFAETLELALTLHPSVRRVFVVARAKTVPEYPERVQGALAKFSNRVEVTYVNEPSVPRLLSVIKTIPPRSLILYTRYTPEDAESVADTVEVARLLAQTSPVPVYSITTLYLGTGVVGGMMRQGRETGIQLGAIAQKVLDGTRPEDIPIEKVGHVPTFDWRQIQRWGIDPARLPRGSDIHFRTPTAWEAHRGIILGTTVIIATQLLLIVGLLTSRAKRRRAERTIRSREATLRSSYGRIRQLAGRLINAQDTARAGIARDLHDDVCQQLVSVSMAINALKNSAGEIQEAETQKALWELERDIGSVFDGIRRLSHDLHPASLRLLGLVPALKTHCKEVEKRYDVRATFNATGDLARLHPDVAVCFFRIAQEALRNAVMHGQARHLAITLVRSGEYVELTVTDDGHGFDLDTVRQSGGGLGLVSIEERARVIGGDVEIVSTPREGTTIRVRGPVVPPERSHHGKREESGEQTPEAAIRAVS